MKLFLPTECTNVFSLVVFFQSRFVYTISMKIQLSIKHSEFLKKKKVNEKYFAIYGIIKMKLN